MRAQNLVVMTQTTMTDSAERQRGGNLIITDSLEGLRKTKNKSHSYKITENFVIKYDIF